MIVLMMETTAPQSNGLLLTTEKLVKEYRGRRVVNGVSMNVSAGEIVGLLGPNGAGKTTTFNMVVGVVKPDEGAVNFRRPRHHAPADAPARAAGHRLSDAGAVGLSQAHGRGKHPGDSGDVQAVAATNARCG